MRTVRRARRTASGWLCSAQSLRHIPCRACDARWSDRGYDTGSQAVSRQVSSAVACVFAPFAVDQALSRQESWIAYSVPFSAM